MTAILTIIKTAWRWLWKTNIDLPPLPVGLYVICLIGIALGGPWLLDRARDALTPDPPPATVVSIERLKPFDLPDLLSQPINVPITIESFKPPDPVATVDSCVSVPVGLHFALIPTQLGWPVFEVSGDQLKLALWQDNEWRRYTYAIRPQKRVRPFIGMQVSDIGVGPYIGFEAVKGRLNLSVDIGRTLAAFGPNVGVRPWHVRAGLRLMF